MDILLAWSLFWLFDAHIGVACLRFYNEKMDTHFNTLLYQNRCPLWQGH